MTTSTYTADDRLRADTRALTASLAPNRGVEVTDDARLIEDLGFDSLLLIELTLAVEEHFGLPPVEVPDTATVTTVGGLADIIAAVKEGVS